MNKKEERITSGTQSPPSILIVEDDVVVASFIRDILTESRYTISGIAHDAKNAERIAARKKTDIALLDIHLGDGENGIELAGKLKTRFAIPAIFITAYDDERTLEEALPIQPLGYLLKPFDDRDLRVAIRLALEKLSTKPPLSHSKSNLANLDVEMLRTKLENLLSRDRLFLDPELNYSRLSTMLGISTHQLSELFNRVIGIGFRDYLRRLRVEEAKRLIQERPDWTLLRIALDAGFNSRTAFHNSFRKLMKMAPEDYRMHCKKE